VCVRPYEKSLNGRRAGGSPEWWGGEAISGPGPSLPPSLPASPVSRSVSLSLARSLSRSAHRPIRARVSVSQWARVISRLERLQVREEAANV